MNTPCINKGLFGFRMRNKILRRSEKSKRGQRKMTSLTGIHLFT